MTVTLITTGLNEMVGPFADVTAGSIDIVWQTATVGGEKFACSGREILLIKNVTGSNTVTITSVDNDKGRAEDLTAYAISGTDIVYWTGGLTNAKGWKQTTGMILVTASSTDVAFAVLRLPAGYP